MSDRVFHFTRQEIDEDDVAAVCEVLRSDFLTGGPAVARFEEAFAASCRASHAVAFSNGTAALHAAYSACGIGPGDEVIVPACTFIATANAVCMTGAVPRFADVDLATLTMGMGHAERLIGPKTRAMVPVHFGGVHADMDALSTLAFRNGLTIIEDACHALGATRMREPAGSCRWSSAAAFSFHPTKQITSAEGGMVTTNDRDLADKLKVFRNHGTVRDPAGFIKPAEGPWTFEMQVLGHNYRMSDVHAALGRSQLAKLAGFVEKRRRLAALYRELLAGHPLILGFQSEPEGVVSSWQVLVMRVDFASATRGRRELFDALRPRGVVPSVHYAPVNEHPWYRSRFPEQVDATPNSRLYYQQCLSIPLSTTMGESDVRYVARALSEEIR